MADETTPIDPTETLDPSEPAEPAGDAAAELAEAKAELDRLRAENARMKKGLHPAPLPPVAPPPAPGVPGDGPVVWEGTLNGDPTAPKLRFRGTPSEAEAREAYLTHAGITGTDKTVRVTKVGEESPPAEAADEELKPKAAAAKPKAAKKK